MSKNYFEKEKIEYENIEIPSELDFMVRKTLKDAKRKGQKGVFYKSLTSIVAVFIAFILSVNMFPQVANAAASIPLIGKLAELVTFDKGLSNAVDKGLVKEINFNEDQNGVRIKVDTVAGDWKALWVGYEISDSNLYYHEVKIKGINGDLQSTYGYTSQEIPDGKHYVQIIFKEFVSEFIFQVDVYKSGERGSEDGQRIKEEKITTFNVPITLDEEMFNSKLEEIEIDSNIIETEIGNIKINKLSSAKTRIGMEFELDSNEYDFMSFENPRLIDNDGTEYKVSPFYSLQTASGNNFIEFQGELNKDVKYLEFICDGVNYAKKDNREIIVDLKNKIVEPNDYNIELVSYEGNSLRIASRGSKSIQFTSYKDSEENELLTHTGSWATMDMSNVDKYEAGAEFTVGNIKEDKVKLDLYYIIRDKTDPCKVTLIK